MGGTSSGVWGDSYSIFWNPAGLWRVDRNEVSVFHASLFDPATTYSSAAVAHPFLQFGVLSVGAIQLRVGGIERRDASNIRLEGDLRNVQSRYVLGYAKDIARGLAAGFNLKLDRYSQGAYTANGFGLDAGAALETAVTSVALDGVAVGLVATNLVEPSINLVAREIGDPRGVRAGVAAWRSVSERFDDRLTLAVDIERARYAETHVHAGFEYRAKGIFAVRGGLDGGHPAFGCGIEAPFAIFDYAYRATELGGTHLFSLSARFGASRAAREEQARVRREAELRREIDAHVADYEARSVEAAIEEAKMAFTGRRYARAAESYARALLWAPMNEEARLGLAVATAALFVQQGDSLVARGEVASALIAYREAQTKDPAQTLNDRIARCEGALREASNRESARAEMLRRSIELYTERRWSEATLGFEAVLALDSGNELASSYLARTRERQEAEHEKALADADALVARGRYGAAAELLQTAQATRPEDKRLAAKLDEIEARRRAAEASASASSETRAPRAPLSSEERERLRTEYERGSELFTGGDFAGAIGSWESVFRAAPAYERVAEYLVRAYQYLGMQQYARHDYEAALETWNKILDVDPDNEKALRYMSRTREELSRLQGLSGP